MHPSDELELTIVVTVVGGKELVRRCLKVLCPQLDFTIAEVIVPYDRSSAEVGELSDEFSQVCFHFINDRVGTSSAAVTPREHRLYDRRRAVGLALARGRLVAMTEDYAVPAEDWCDQLRRAHEQPYSVIGGAIENAVDHPLNWALYYCDFGRYGRPLRCRKVKYLSDVNVAYKRHAIQSVRQVWEESYQETSVHWALLSQGDILFLNPGVVVYQHRPRISISQAYRERIEWGRVFAETRTNVSSGAQRIILVVLSLPLSLLLLIRVLRHMIRQGRTLKQMALSLPLVMFLLTGWSLGELIGYIVGSPEEAPRVQAQTSRAS